MTWREVLIFLFFLVLFLVPCIPEIYTWFDHSSWKGVPNPKLDATIVDISSEKVKYRKNGAKFFTVVTFSDGFQFITHDTKVDTHLFSYTISIDNALLKKIINKAIAAHTKAITHPSKAVKRYIEEGRKMEQEQLAQLQKQEQEALERKMQLQQEAQRREEARQQLQKNTDEAGRLAAFVAEAETYDQVRDISSLWGSIPKEDNALTEAITQTIENAAKLERMYGTVPSNTKKLIADIRKLL